MSKDIQFTNVRVNNLKSVSGHIPSDCLVAITGVSGSGKSSFIFDTIYRESQRRLFRLMFSNKSSAGEKFSRPDCDEIKGLSPAIAVGQTHISSGPRSTVGTMSSIYDLLRLLYSRFSIPFCPNCNVKMAKTSLLELSQKISSDFDANEISIWLTLVDGHYGSYEQLILKLKNANYKILDVDGEKITISDDFAIEASKRHIIKVLLGRCSNTPKTINELLSTSNIFSKENFTISVDSLQKDYSTTLICSSCNYSPTERGTRLFSFNSTYGMCPECKGLGEKDQISIKKLVANENLTLREGALVPTTGSGYIIYSQVTIEVLNKVCNEHGFNVDIPWKDLTEEQKNVILFGSEKIKIPFGKHPLENRLKWKGITAKPRENGYYRGMLPIMNQILQKDRNDNILRFAQTIPCPSCAGSRLSKVARSFKYNDVSISKLSTYDMNKMKSFFSKISTKNIAEAEIIEQIQDKINALTELGLSYLTLNRSSETLSRGETGRIRLINLASSGLQGVTFILDEPSTGLHPSENINLLKLLRKLVANGNSVLLVEHDPFFIFQADWIVEFGPIGGENGGNLLFNGNIDNFIGLKGNSKHSQLLDIESNFPKLRKIANNTPNEIQISNIFINNINNMKLSLRFNQLNSICGVSGSGKKSLVNEILIPAINNYTKHKIDNGENYAYLTGCEKIKKVLIIDRKPVGKNSRSNPATYTKLFDHIRDIFAKQPLAIANNLDKSHFSFNVEGGRCEICQGAGFQKLGLMFLGDVKIKCSACNGQRFKEKVLSVKFLDHNISEILNLTVDQASKIFSTTTKILPFLKSLQDIGLGYITLGQPSSTLSGGESQRIKLATELVKKNSGQTLYVLDEPTTGLHYSDIKPIIQTLYRLIKAGNTIVAIEHNEYFIENSDWVVELGPGSGNNGGEIIYSGKPENMNDLTQTGIAMKAWKSISYNQYNKPNNSIKENLSFSSVTTNNLANIDIELPHNQISVIGGISGSGKSSLAFDSIFAEGQRLFNYNLSSYARRYIKQLPRPPIEIVSGLKATVAFRNKTSFENPRSTIATASGLYDIIRILFSRVGISPVGKQYPAESFSFNNSIGACDQCHGNGFKMVCTPENITSNRNQSVYNGAISGSKQGKFYSDINGQFIAILNEVSKVHSIDFDVPIVALAKADSDILFYGTGNTQYKVNWQFKTKSRKGEHNWNTTWKGFCNLIEEEYERKHHDYRGNEMLHLFTEKPCKYCKGSRLKPELTKVCISDYNIYQFCNLSVAELLPELDNLNKNHNLSNTQLSLIKRIQPELMQGLDAIAKTGLGYLPLTRRVSTLSGGEQQRLKLASQFISEMQNIIYVFDEPSAGLHPKDNEKLLSMLRFLRDLGNTIIVVEHDSFYFDNADYLIELGPEAGNKGGQIIYSGPPINYSKNNSQLFSIDSSKSSPISDNNIEIQTNHKTFNSSLNIAPINNSNDKIIFKKATARNLKGFDFNISINLITCITGVSGSGKSTLVNDVILPSLYNQRPINCMNIENMYHFDSIFTADQTPIHTNSRSSVSTFTGIFDLIRSEYAGLLKSKQDNKTKSWFSYNTKGGRCEKCKGLGEVKVKMDFLADIKLPCDECNQTGFTSLTNDYTLKGLSISDVLNTTVSEAINIFNSNKKLQILFNNLVKAGLGYIKLGQKTSALSAGELQRLKIAKMLGKLKNSLFIFDEPSKGLHPKDICKIIKLFEELISHNNTIILIDHNPQIQIMSNNIIDLGPVGGKDGGYLIKAGSALDIIKCDNSETGNFLKNFNQLFL